MCVIPVEFAHTIDTASDLFPGRSYSIVSITGILRNLNKLGGMGSRGALED